MKLRSAFKICYETKINFGHNNIEVTKCRTSFHELTAELYRFPLYVLLSGASANFLEIIEVLSLWWTDWYMNRSSCENNMTSSQVMVLYWPSMIILHIKWLPVTRQAQWHPNGNSASIQCVIAKESQPAQITTDYLREANARKCSKIQLSGHERAKVTGYEESKLHQSHIYG